MLRRQLALVALTSCASPALAQVQSVVLNPVRDTTLYSDAGGVLSNGAGTGMFVGLTGQGRVVRGLLVFDLASAIPAGSAIGSVELVLNMNMTRGAAMAIGAHRVTTAWGEGASVASRGGGGGAPAQNGDATWLNSFFQSQLWTTPGGDFVATASATRTVSSSGGFFTWASNASFVSDAQDMLDQPATNFGWLLKGDENNSAMRFSTRESSSTLRPQLRVLYAPRATLTSFGTGCNSTLGTPLVLSTTGAPVLGGSWNAQLTGAPEGSASFLFFAIGLEPTPLPIGNGCSIYLNAASMQLFASIGISPYAPAIVTNGVADHTILIPFQVLLGGLQVEYQALLLDPFPVVLRSSNVQRAVLGF